MELNTNGTCPERYVDGTGMNVSGAGTLLSGPYENADCTNSDGQEYYCYSRVDLKCVKVHWSGKQNCAQINANYSGTLITVESVNSYDTCMTENATPIQCYKADGKNVSQTQCVAYTKSKQPLLKPTSGGRNYETYGGCPDSSYTEVLPTSGSTWSELAASAKIPVAKTLQSRPAIPSEAALVFCVE